MGKVAVAKTDKPVTTDKAPPSSSPVKSKLAPYNQVDPPDVEQLGRSSWTLLHSVASTYPEQPSTKEQSDMKQFLKLFGNFYPCWWCGEDFQKYMTTNEPQVETQDKFGKWLCDAHNEVNAKLGKPKFNCNLWKQRWKDGWEENSD
jgi:FAD-linked sulfhydryl oxidase